MSQCDQILEHIRAHGSITPLEALTHYNCMRLGARIWELHRRGFVIESEPFTVASGKTVARYFFPEKQLSIQFKEA